MRYAEERDEYTDLFQFREQQLVKSCLETCRSYPGVAASSDNGVIKGVYVFVYKQTGMVSRVNVPGNRGVFLYSFQWE